MAEWSRILRHKPAGTEVWTATVTHGSTCIHQRGIPVHRGLGHGMTQVSTGRLCQNSTTRKQNCNAWILPSEREVNHHEYMCRINSNAPETRSQMLCTMPCVPTAVAVWPSTPCESCSLPTLCCIASNRSGSLMQNKLENLTAVPMLLRLRVVISPTRCRSRLHVNAAQRCPDDSLKIPPCHKPVTKGHWSNGRECSVHVW